MSVFEALAERRYQDWLEKVSAPGHEPPPANNKTATRTSYEGYIFKEVLLHLDKAGTASTESEQAECLDKARKLEMQLIILLEQRKLPHAAVTLRASIASHRQRIVERASTTPSSATAKPASWIRLSDSP